jgi:hypothetical protein
MYPTTSKELQEKFAIVSHEIAKEINCYVASDKYRNRVKSVASAINSVSQQFNQQCVERTKNE